MPILEAIIGALVSGAIGGITTAATATEQAKQAGRARRKAAEQHAKAMALQKEEAEAQAAEMRKKKMQLAEQSTPMSSDPGAIAVMQASVDPIGLVASAGLPKKNQFIQNV
tara:strand:+ start:350 stop:682 length:333 start_codon:yes stop_codon:yes gene_type:complete